MPKSQINHIFECCKNGRIQQLLDALESTNDSHIVDERQNSVLAMALKSGHWQTAESLIENNITYFHVNKPGLISACQCKKDDTHGIQLALKLGSDINSRDQQQRTALMTVSLLGHINKAQELIENRANITLQDNHGNTALMDAVQSKNKNMVQLILKQNPEIDQTNKQDETALILELKQKSPVEDIVTQLLKAGSNPELFDNNKKSAWLIAKQKHPKMARLIEIHLNNVNQIELPFFSNDYQTKEKPEPFEAETITEQQVNKQTSTVINEKHSKHSIKATLNNEPRIEPSIDLTPATSIDELEPEMSNETTKKQEAMKHTSIGVNEIISDDLVKQVPAIKAKIEPCIETKLSKNIDKLKPQLNSKTKTIQNLTETIKPNSRKPYIFTKKPKKPNQQEWFHAAKTGNLGGLNRMIIEGIDIDCIDDKGCTALIRASGHSRRAVVSFLLQQNANIEARSHNGSTAMSTSIIGNCRHVAGLLLDNGANVNALGPSDYSYVTIAAAQWNDAMLSILYRNGGDIFVINNSNQSLLHIIALAAEYYNNVNNAKTSIQYLLDHGMDINSQDKNGDTALMILSGTHKKKYEVDDRNIASIVHCLIKMGAAAAINNKAGNSALDACRQHKLLQTKGVLMNALSWND